MMQGFDAVTLSWKGESYTVPADRQLDLIARIESALEGPDREQAVHVLMRPNGPPYARLAQAFGAALRFSGASVSDSEIYLSIQNDFADGDADVAIKVQNAILALLAIVSPPVALALSDMGDVKKKTTDADNPAS